MKLKPLVLVIVLVISSSCSQNKYEANALESLSANINKLSSSDNLNIDLNGEAKIPKNVAINEEISGAINLDFTKNSDNYYFSYNLDAASFLDFIVKYELYADKDYYYIFENSEHYKIDHNNMSSDMFIEDVKPLRKNDLKEAFKGFKSKKYSKKSVNGVDGYLIETKTTLYSFFKNYEKEIMQSNPDFDMKSIAPMLKVAKVSLEIFTPEEINGSLDIKFSLVFNYFGYKVSIDDVKIAIDCLNEDVVIPQKFKDAPLREGDSLDFDSFVD